eukprot:CAMPEP_0182600886 /NCGR_PEP_ID=MMETSP1324-20130603/91210_1 /TAXON_ID=236786 /ORGANISM="Florenciella sp., Strain RCC1587" /LENGTH=291 /DNA_ID=CAMNT_0024818795 /DNA_START=755 /DNA_END=1632 /DNA_ORIENTATION=-
MPPNHHQRQHQRSGPDPITQQEGGLAGATPARRHQSYQPQSSDTNQQGTALAPTPTRQRRLARRRGSERQTTRIRAATSAAPPGSHIHAHASVAARASAQKVARAKVPRADVLASVSPSASAEYKPRVAEPPVSKHNPARCCTRAYLITAAPARTPQGAEAVTTRIRAATSAAPLGFHVHAHASVAVPSSAQKVARAKVPRADVLASVSPSASAEYEPRGRAAMTKCKEEAASLRQRQSGASVIAVRFHSARSHLPAEKAVGRTSVAVPCEGRACSDLLARVRVTIGFGGV